MPPTVSPQEGARERLHAGTPAAMCLKGIPEARDAHCHSCLPSGTGLSVADIGIIFKVAFKPHEHKSWKVGGRDDSCSCRAQSRLTGHHSYFFFLTSYFEITLDPRKLAKDKRSIEFPCSQCPRIRVLYNHDICMKTRGEY